MKHLIIVGPTASGKTKLSIELAHHFNAEIIAADSRTVYKGMDIGTAKPSIKEREGIRHYCIDIADPSTQFTVADFVQAARQARSTILGKGLLDITVGGSGLYIDAFVYDFSFTEPNKEVREKYAHWDVTALHQELERKKIPMPINKMNKRHLIAALEREGLPAPTRKALPKDSVIVGIMPPREVLLERIVLRANLMMEAGVVGEVRQLYERYGLDAPAFKGGPYAALRSYILDGGTYQEAIEALVMYDKKLAKRQITWFKRNKDIKWFDSIEQAKAWCITIENDYAYN